MQNTGRFTFFFQSFEGGLRNENKCGTKSALAATLLERLQ